MEVTEELTICIKELLKKNLKIDIEENLYEKKIVVYFDDEIIDSVLIATFHDGSWG